MAFSVSPPPPAAAASFSLNGVATMGTLHKSPTTSRRPPCLIPRFRPSNIQLPHANCRYFSTSPILCSISHSPAAHGTTLEAIPLTKDWAHNGAPSLQHKVVDQHSAQQMQGWVDEIRGMFQSMTLGEVSVSPYDTAWVAMVPSLNGSNNPQFPKCLHWIIENQLFDGSWGDKDLFIAYDRICNTVACLIALKTWNIGQVNIQKGVEFIHKHINMITKEVDDHMPTAFEIVFPTMLDDAKVLGINLPYNSPVVENIRKEGKRKLDRIPMDLLHTNPTTLLHSLEGLHKLVDWKKLLKLQTNNGSFLFSTASTACALKYTGDEKCLNYLNLVLKKFNNAVPSVYPLDLFERLWMVDRLERLGVSRYFKREIKECLDYVYKYWTPKGIAWASDSNTFDVDDTAMGFRLLRLHGYPVCSDVFSQFKKNGEFFCFEGQTSQAVTGMHNLYRASQITLPNEAILEEARHFTKSFLIAKQKRNELKDKWVISKGLEGEVAYTLNYPWDRSLQRIEARKYIDNYGVDDAWIAKSLYKMFYINNEVFLKLAKADYNVCQSFQKSDLAQVHKWNEECEFGKLKFARQRHKECFFAAAATLFEPEHSIARIAWTMCSVLTTVIDDFYDLKGTSLEELETFLHVIKSWDLAHVKGLSQDMKILFMGLYNALNKFQQEALRTQERDIIFELRNVWVKFVESIYIESKWKLLNYVPSLEEYMKNGKDSIGVEPIVHATIFFLGEKLSEQDLNHANYTRITDLANLIGRVNNDIQGLERDTKNGNLNGIRIFLKENPKANEMEAIQYFKNLSEDAMKELLREYLQNTRISKKCKQIHLNMAKILNLFYSKSDGYTSAIDMHEHVQNTLYMPIP